MQESLPLIDISSLFSTGDSHNVELRQNKRRVATEIESACRDHGFFFVTGHGVSPDLFNQLDQTAREFFAQPESIKRNISMDRGGRAWRGYFPTGGELTSGKPDQKEGIYFGTELPETDSRVVAGLPLHGANLWPAGANPLKNAVTTYMTQMTFVAQTLLRGIALSLDLQEDYFQRFYTQDPTILFRIFHYPPVETKDLWGVGEHTDYGLLTLLAQDDHGGLQVKSRGRWIEVAPIENALVCNIGDMLDRLTAGWYVSTPHRVRAQTGVGRLSFPFFFDPDFNAEMRPLPLEGRLDPQGNASPRWDESDLHAFEGTYGDYLLSKVSKVFPQLVTQVLE